MKKQFLCLIAVSAICSLSALGQISKPIIWGNMPKASYSPVNDHKRGLLASPITDVKSGGVLQATFANRFIVDDGNFTYFQPNTYPIAYEPVSNTLGIIHNSIFGGSGTIGDTLVMYYSTNGGNSWAAKSKVLNISPIDYDGMPQLAFVNPNNSGFSGVNYFALTQNYPKSNNYRRNSVNLYYIPSDDALVKLPYNGPLTNNPSGYLWGSASLVGYTTSSKNGFLYAGRLAVPDQSTIQYGQYGILSVKGQIVDDADVIGTIPSTWGNSQFRPAPATSSSYNGPMYSDVDSDGNIYAITNAIFADDQDHRVPAFSKSTDMGKTWTTFVRMPASALTTYATSRGGDFLYSPSNQAAYEQDAFVVTGVNKFSYFYRVGVAKGSGQDAKPVGLDIIEVYHDNGNWGIRQVANFNGNPTMYYYSDSLSKLNGYTKTITEESDSPLGNELQVAKTADGNDIVLKWIDYNVGIGPIVVSPAQTFMRRNDNGDLEEKTLDTIYTTDIFVSYRSLSQSSWNTAVNVTNDKYFDKGTKMPTIVPSATSIPIMALRFITDNQWTSTRQDVQMWKNTPDEYFSMIPNMDHNIGVALVSAKTSPVEETTENSASTFTMSSIAPNPVADNAEVSFNSSISGIAQLNIVNTLGEKVMNVYEGAIQPGVHGFNIDSANLPSGSYIVSLTINGKTQTRTLNVIH